MARQTRWIALLVTALALAMTACSGDSTQDSAQSASATGAQESSASSGGLEVGKTGFGISRSHPGTGPDYVWAAAVIKNNTDKITGMTVSFSIYDQSDLVIGQSETSAPIMRAGTTMPIGTVVEVPGGSEVDKVVATVSPLEGLSQKDDHPESAFTTTGVHMQIDPTLKTVRVLGEVVSGYQQSVKEVYVSVVCYNAANEIIGGGEHYVTAIDPGQKVGFSTSNLTVTGEPDRCEAFATLSGLSVF